MIRARDDSIYAGRDPSEIPAYTLAEAAHWLGLPLATTRAWSLGQKRFRPVIAIADESNRSLSFRNLVELHVLAAIRRQREIPLQQVRKAVDAMRTRLGVAHPLASRKMLTDGTSLLVEFSGELLNLSEAGQLEMRRIVEAYLSRVDHGETDRPVRLFPFTTSDLEAAPRSVVIDPRIQFGRPCLTGTGIPTSVVAERFKAGESLEEIALDYEKPAGEVAEAIRYELELAA